MIEHVPMSAVRLVKPPIVGRAPGAECIELPDHLVLCAGLTLMEAAR